MWDTTGRRTASPGGNHGAGQNRRPITSRIPLALIGMSLLGLLLVASIVIAGYMLLAGEEGAKALPSAPAGAESLIIRVSGTEGVVYKGVYATSFTDEDETTVKEATIDSDPTEYEVDLQGGKDKAVLADFTKTQSGTGQLKVEIVADGEVAVEGATNIDKGSVFIDWGLENVPPPKIPKFKPPPLEIKPPPPPEAPPAPKFDRQPKPKMPPPPKFD